MAETAGSGGGEYAARTGKGRILDYCTAPLSSGVAGLQIVPPPATLHAPVGPIHVPGPRRKRRPATAASTKTAENADVSWRKATSRLPCQHVAVTLNLRAVKNGRNCWRRGRAYAARTGKGWILDYCTAPLSSGVAGLQIVPPPATPHAPVGPIHVPGPRRKRRPATAASTKTAENADVS